MVTGRQTKAEESCGGQNWTRRAMSVVLAGTALSTLIGAETDAKRKKKRKKKGKGKGSNTPEKPTCTPSCGNRTCGDDGCNGSCGTCSAGTTCDSGQCVAATSYVYDRQWGSYGSEPGKFQFPWGVAIDADDNVYIADSGNDRIQKFDGDGNLTLSWGESGTNPGQFDEPSGITVTSAGVIYVADSKNHRIQKFSGTGTPLLAWGEAGSEDGQFIRPTGIAISPKTSLIYITESYLNKRVQVFNESTFVSTLSLIPPAEVRGATVAPDGTVFVVSTGSGTILRLSNDGSVAQTIGSKGSADGQLSGPWDAAVDADGNLFVVDRGNNRIQVFDAAGNFVTGWGTFGAGNGQFKEPMGIELDSTGNVYVTDIGNARVQKFRPAAARRRSR